MVNWFYFCTENWPNFSIHTTTVKELVYQVYFHLKYNFYYTGTKKVPLSENINNLWLISDVLSNKCGFCVFP